MAKKAEDKRDGGHLIVAVNDDRVQLGVLEGVLSGEGHNVRVFNAAEAALADMDPNAPPDLIITDLFMPGIDGWRFCRLLRSPDFSAFNAIPILVISATFAGEVPSNITTELGANAFLPAPVDSELLIKTARSLIRGEQPQSVLRVLVVDDSKMQADMLARHFTRQGCVADAAYSGKDAQAFFAAHKYDLAVLDYHLPDVQGDQLLREFRAANPDTVCIMITTDPRPELAVEWMKAGAAEYLRKPFDVAYLYEQCSRARRERALLRVEELLDRRTKELHESEERFSDLFDNLPVGVYKSTLDGKILLSNQACLEIARCRTAQERLEWFAQDTRKSYLYPEDGERLRDMLLKDGHVNGFVAPMMRFDGTIGWLSNTARLVKDPQGNPLYISGSFVDVTEQKNAEDTLRMHTLVLNQIQDRVTITDLEGNITYVNDAAMKSLGYTREQLLGSPTEVYGEDPERGATQREIVEETLRDGYWRGEVVNYTASGDNVIMDCRTQVVRDDQGLPVALCGIATDITERKRMENALREREERLNLALETARLGYWRWTAADNRVQWFGDHAALFGITDAEFGGTLDDVQKHVHPDDRSMGMKNISRAVDERIPFDNTYRVVHPDGSIHWLNSFGRVTFDDAGNPLSMFGITRDISQYKFAQEALEERLAQLTVLLNSMQCGVLVENNQRRILFANQDFSGIFGVPAPEDILGANCAEHLPEAADLFIDPDGFISGIEHCIATGNVVANELLHMKDGRVLERTYAPILRDQRTFGHLWIYRDQTEQIRLQQNYQTLFVEMLSGFAVHDIICDDTGRPVDYRFLDINPAFEKLTGLGRDIIGKTVLEVLPGTEPYWIETYGQVALTGEPAHFDNYSVALDRHYEVSAFRTAPGQFACLIADVTARKKAQEELLRAKEAAEATSRAKSEFLANMSHELRTPLNPIIGFAEFLLEDESATEEQREILTIIRKRGEDLLQLLSDILDMARAEAHRLVIKPRATNVAQVVGDAVDMFRQSAEEKELQLNMNIGTGLDSPLVLDPVRLRQILLNLIGNAVKFTTEGNVTVSAALENDDTLHLLVKDTGPGVPAEKQSLIFEPFEQVDTSFSRLHGGVGLGLPICKRLAELMGGSIRLESAPGQGAAFYVSLPVSHAENITDT